VRKSAPVAAFDATQAKVIPPCDGDLLLSNVKVSAKTSEQFLRPDESDRAARAKRWLAVARGANLQTEPKE
jgi:hypothetical protein